MVFNLEFLIRLAFTCGGIWLMYTGICISLLKGEEFFRGGGILRVPMGICVVVIGVIVIYYANLYPPLTKMLEPFAVAVFQIPKKVMDLVQGKQPVRIPR